MKGYHSVLSKLLGVTIVNVLAISGCSSPAPTVPEPAVTPEISSSFTADSLVQSEPLFIGGKLFFADVSGNIYSFDTESGEQLWQQSIGAATTSSPIVAGDLLIIGGNDNTVHALEIETGSERWAREVTGWVGTKAVFDQGLVVFGSDDGGVYAVSAMSGDIEWSVQTGSPIRSNPIIHEDTVFVGSDDNHIYGLSLDNGSIVWRFRTSGEVRSSPRVSGGVLLFGSNDNFLYAIDVSSRRQIWRYDTGYAISSPPSINGGLVFQGNDRGDLFGLDMHSGVLVWQGEVGGTITSSTAMSDGRLIVGSENRSIGGFTQENGSRLWSVASRDAVIGVGVERGQDYCVGSHKSIICLRGGAVSGGTPTLSPVVSVASEDRPRSLADCEESRGDSTRFGYCRMQLASDTDLAINVSEMCAGTGDWEDACRQAWAVSRAENHQSDWSRDLLLTACLENADCIFEVLDHRRSQDLFEQLILCHRHAGEFSNDCAVHALDRWIHTGPTTEDVERLGALDYFRVQAGQYSASSAVCWGVGECPEDEIGQAACLQKKRNLEANEQLCRRLR